MPVGAKNQRVEKEEEVNFLEIVKNAQKLFSYSNNKTLAFRDLIIKDGVFSKHSLNNGRLSIFSLHEELIDLYRYLRPSPLEEQIRKQVFEKVSFFMMLPKHAILIR